MTRLVLLGGGHAHAQVLLKFRNFVSRYLDVTLVNAGPVHTYSGMVPGVIAGHYAAVDAQIDLARLARDAGAQFIAGRVQRIELDAKQVTLESGVALDYDVLSLNLGSVPEGLPAHAIAAKPFEGFVSRWRTLLNENSNSLRIAVAGAGAGGVELAMAMKYALDLRGEGSSVEIFSDRFAFPSEVAGRIRNALAGLSIPLFLDTRIKSGFDAVVWVTGASALPVGSPGTELEFAL